MNALQRVIAENEVVVVAAKFLQPGLTLFQRCLVVHGGFGMDHRLHGSAVIGAWLDGTGRDRVEGHWLSPKETTRLQAVFGKQPTAEQVAHVRTWRDLTKKAQRARAAAQEVAPPTS